MNIRSHLIFFILTLMLPIYAQDIPISTENKALYEFIDELAACHYIRVNQLIKPYSQNLVEECLAEAEFHYNRMTKRQQQEWQFYKDNIVWHGEDRTQLSNRVDIIKGREGTLSLSPLGFFSHKKNMTFALKPILEAQFYNNSKGMEYHRSVGLEMDLTVGNWGFYANAQESAESERLSSPRYLVNTRGANYKSNDYSDMLGGVTYANGWISLGVVKDYVEWGSSQNGANIISDRAPSFAQFKMKVKPVEWFEFNYVHGWLVSDVIDSSRSYVMSTGDRRDVMYDKFIAANMFTIYPFKTLGLSAGNSIIYSAENAKLQYLNPMMFYKSVDHTYNSTDGTGRMVGQNSQMFFDANFRGIKKVFLYCTLFVDELKIERWKHKDEHNFYSYKAGIKLTQVIPNTSFGFEYTHTTPITYQHDVTTTTFESNSYNMGHYLRDNAEEFYTYVHFRPVKNLRLKLSYIHIRKGEEYDYIRDGNLVKHSFIEELKYENSTWEFLSEYQLAYDMFFNFRIGQSSISGEDMTSYVPPHFRGKQFNVMFGANIGF